MVIFNQIWGLILLSLLLKIFRVLCLPFKYSIYLVFIFVKVCGGSHSVPFWENCKAYGLLPALSELGAHDQKDLTCKTEDGLGLKVPALERLSVMTGESMSLRSPSKEETEFWLPRSLEICWDLCHAGTSYRLYKIRDTQRLCWRLSCESEPVNVRDKGGWGGARLELTLLTMWSDGSTQDVRVSLHYSGMERMKLPQLH